MSNGLPRPSEIDSEFGRQRDFFGTSYMEGDSETLHISGSPSVAARLDFVQDPDEWLYEGLEQVRNYIIFNLVVSILTLGGLLGLLLFL